MRFLLVFPGIEETEYRGIQRITTNVLQSLKDLNIPVDLLIGSPRIGNKIFGEYIGEGINSTFLRYYFTQQGSINRTYSRGEKFIKVIKALLGKFYRYPVTPDLITNETLILKYVDGLLQIPFVYQLIWNKEKAIYNTLINWAVRRYKYDAVITSSPVDLQITSSNTLLIQTILDMIPFESTDLECNKNIFNLGIITKRAIEHSDLILTISEDVKSKILKIKDNALVKNFYAFPQFIIPVDKITKNEEKNLLDNLSIKKNKYIFYVGALEKRKNIVELIKAYSIVHDNVKVPLVLAGPKGLGYDKIERQMSLLNKKVRNDVIILDYVSDYEKYILMKNAKTFVFIPKSEGLGLQVMESIYLHVPVLASSIPTLHEIGGNSTIFVEKYYNSNEIAEKLLDICNNKKLRNRLIKNTYKDSKKRTYDIFKEKIRKALNLFFN